MDKFLRASEVVDWEEEGVRAKARELAGGGVVEVVRRCFEWVRDEIKHTGDCGLSPVTCAASEVLAVGSGFCYAKSHLLAALLRANGIAAGLCYQRLCVDDEAEPKVQGPKSKVGDGQSGAQRRFCLHGLNAVWLPGTGWYRIDPRGNRAGIDAQFVPPVEKLAFAISRQGEADLPEVWADPLPVVVEALRAHERAEELGEKLPDVEVWGKGPG